ncbi:hypothetical protein [Nocardia africana]
MNDSTPLAVEAAALLASAVDGSLSRTIDSSSWHTIAELRRVVEARLACDGMPAASFAEMTRDPTPASRAAVARDIQTWIDSDAPFTRDVERLLIASRGHPDLVAMVAHASGDAKQINIGGDNLGDIHVSSSQHGIPLRWALGAIGAVIVLALVATTTVAVLTEKPSASTGVPKGAPQIAAPTVTPIQAVAQSANWSPLAVTDVADLAMQPGARAFSTPDPAGVDAATLGRNDVGALYTRYHGVPIGQGTTTFTVRNIVDEPVRITRMSVEKQCGDPFNGTYFQGYGQAGPAANIQIGIDLDSPTPIVQEMYVGDNGFRLAGPDYFLMNTVTVDPGGMQTFSLGAMTDRYGCAFSLRVFVATSRGTVYTDINVNGQQFRVTALSQRIDNNHFLSGYRTLYTQNEDHSWSQADPKTYR